MHKVLGILLILAGLALGAYVGAYLLLVEGVIEFIKGVTANPVSSHEIAWGAVRAILAWPLGWACAYIAVLPGVAISLSE